MAHVRITLPVEPLSVRRGRHVIDELEGLSEDVRDRAKLIVSELLTNAIMHGDVPPGDFIHLRMTTGEHLEGEIVHPGDGFVPPAQADVSGEESGRGLYIVSKVADAWGVDGAGGTRVWFRIALTEV